MKRLISAAVMLWLLIWGFGVGLHQAAVRGPNVPNHIWTSVAGFDGEGYLLHYRSFRYTFEFSTRHPLASVVMLPARIVGGRVMDRFGEEASAVAILMFFALMAAASIALVNLITHDLGATALFTAFAYTWMLGATADLFALSELILLGTLLLVRHRETRAPFYLGMAALAGAVTVTNGLKPLLAMTAAGYMKRPSRRALVWSAVGGGTLALVAVSVCYVKWQLWDGIGFWNGLSYSWRDIVACLPADNSLLLRLRMFWEGFVCEPILFHGPVVATDEFFGGYASMFPHILVSVLVAVSVCGAVRGRREPVVRAALAMCTVDFLLHVVIGWGANEGQIYCGHWFFVFPILLAQVGGSWWKFLLAAAAAVWNLSKLPTVLA